MKYKNIVGVVQCTPSDLFKSEDPTDYCIAKVKNSQLFDDVVLAVPKIGNYKIFKKICKRWGVDVYFGSPFNVAERIYYATKIYQPEIVVRLLLKRFYLDLDLLRMMIKILRRGYDYVDLDKDVNYEVTGDVMSFKALEKAVRLIEKLPDDYSSHKFRFSPWSFIIYSPDKFKVATMPYKKSWDKNKVKNIKNKLKSLLADEESKSPLEIDNPANRYRYILPFISATDSVLDIACGQGEGAFILSKKAKIVHAYDRNKVYIKKAKVIFQKKNLGFINGTDKTLLKSTFVYDKIVSLHTLEHVRSDILFLKRLKERLKYDGKLIVEVPRLMKYPVQEPLNPFHIREYSHQQMVSLLTKTGFEIEIAEGKDRGRVVVPQQAREVLFYVCRKK